MNYFYMLYFGGVFSNKCFCFGLGYERTLLISFQLPRNGPDVVSRESRERCY